MSEAKRSKRRHGLFRKLLVANRSEIAIRVLRAASELGIRTVAIYSHEDRFSLHRFKADEAYLVGAGLDPIQAYLDIDEVLRIALDAGADAIHPGYGFLSENPALADSCAAVGITFIGPRADVMRLLGSKLEARRLAERAGIPVVPATQALPEDVADASRLAEAVGYPLMLKASWGGGGRGMRVVEGEAQLAEQVAAGRREAFAAFGSDEVFLERLVRRARHVEVQILGDYHGNVVHLLERDCSMQRRNQKVVERAPAPYLSTEERDALCESAVRLGQAAGYENAGTVEFLYDLDAGRFLPRYVEEQLLSVAPFVEIDAEGVGGLVRIGVERGRSAKPGLKIGICGEHGGNPASVEFFHGAGLDYVSCSPYREIGRAHV